jgi:isoleucyl-tRNA synthetase
LGDVEIFLNDVAIQREVATDWVVGSHGPFVVALDPVLTPELRQEGLARELVNRVQRLRKEAGLAYTDRITLSVDGPPELMQAVDANAEFIRGETLTRELVLGVSHGAPDRAETVTIDGLALRLAIRRVPGATPQAEPQPMDAS